MAGWQTHWPPGVFGGQAAPVLAWSASKAPLPADAAGGSDQNAFLDGVSCAAAGRCVAVGSYQAGGGTGAVPTGLVETLAQGTWTPAAVSDVTAAAGGTANLVGVSCPVSGSCVATGRYTDQSGHSESLLDTLSGGTWTAVKAPLPADAAMSGQLAALRGASSTPTRR